MQNPAAVRVLGVFGVFARDPETKKLFQKLSRRAETQQIGGQKMATDTSKQKNEAPWALSCAVCATLRAAGCGQSERPKVPPQRGGWHGPQGFALALVFCRGHTQPGQIPLSGPKGAVQAPTGHRQTRAKPGTTTSFHDSKQPVLRGWGSTFTAITIEKATGTAQNTRIH